MPVLLPIGLSDFRTLREQGAWYADKTAFLVGVLDSATAVFLFPRPRRFGKTLNLSTLRYFVERPHSPWDATPLFEDLAVWRSAAARRHFQRHPVISLSFKGVKEPTWEATWEGLRSEVARALRPHRDALASANLAPAERDAVEALCGRDAPLSLVVESLSLLTEILHQATGERVLVLVDEYDVPIQAGYVGGFYEEVVTFFRSFLTRGLKDNSHLFKGVLTGVTRVAKESIFSGLNNLRVWSILSKPFSADFGFTGAEVANLCAAVGLPGILDEIRRWYDGYDFAGATIYNPWSVLCYAGEPEAGLRPYWVHTSSEDILRKLLLERGHALSAEIGTLLEGGTITRVVDDNIVFPDLDRNPEAPWSLLLMSGYLTPRAQQTVEGQVVCELAIPNREIGYLFRTSITDWLRDGLGRADKVTQLLRAMLGGDVKSFSHLLSELVVRTLSYHDTGGHEPERVYRAFILGLMVHLGDAYEVRSDRESGYGRCDVLVCPRSGGKPGVVMELKRIDAFDEETTETAMASALRQVRDRRYAEELRSRGAEPIREYGIVFDGKRVWVGVP